MAIPTDPTIGAASQGGPAPYRVPGYEVLEEIGRGGMGVVYRARQVGLDRIVALKVAIAGEHAPPDTIERFLREARSAGRLHHPNIVPVYDVGREGSLFYFTMRWVEGSSLAKAIHAARPAPRRAAEIARTVALALDTAHAAGIIHRDVKPGNILLDAAGDSSPEALAKGEPLLSDFGLVKDLSSDAITAPGAVLGTPSYAAPEQLSGEPVDARTDVYGLGATLYELLTGRPPFVGDSPMAVVYSVLSKDAVAPRAIDPAIPADLEVICLTAMDRDPARRYPTARALADDLERHLAGEPIRARPPSTLALFARGIRRRRGVVSAALASLVVVAIAATWAIRASRHGADVQDAHAEAAQAAAASRREADARASRAEEIAAKAERVSGVLARWRRLREPVLRLDALRYDRGKTLDERTRGREEGLAEVARFVSATPDDSASRAAAAGLSGWALWLAGRDEEGLSRMRGAEEADPDVPLGRLMEALVLFVTYVQQVKLPAIEETGGRLRFLAPEGEDDGMRRDRVAIDALLLEASKAAVWGKEGSEDFAAAVRAVRAFHEGNFDEADGALTKALDAPDLDLFQKELLYARALVRYFRHRFAEARADLLEIRAARPGQPEVPYYLGESGVGMAMQASLEGRDPRALYTEAIARMDEAIALDPNRAKMLVGRGGAHYWKGEAEAIRGGDAAAEQERAVADFDKALSIDAGQMTARLNRGSARLRWGVALHAAGGDPSRLYAQALEDYDALLAANPKDSFALSNRGLVWQCLGDCEAAAGQSPIGSYERSILDYEAGTALDDTDAAMRTNLGNAWLRKGAWEQARGIDPRASFDRAIAIYGEAIDRKGTMGEAYGNRGTAWLLRGKTEATRGEDPSGSWKRAMDDLGRSLDLHADPGMYGAHRAELGVAIAAWKAARNEDPSAEYEGAIADCTRALETNPSSPKGVTQRMKARVAYGQWQVSKGKDPTAVLDAAIADAAEAARLQPGLPDAWTYRGMAWRARAAWEEKSGGDPRPSYRKAIEEYGRAMAASAGDVSAPYNRGNAWSGMGSWEASKGMDAKASNESALADYEAALARDGRFWRAMVNAGDLLERLGRYDEAVKWYEAAQALAGSQMPQLGQLIERARAKAKR